MIRYDRRGAALLVALAALIISAGVGGLVFALVVLEQRAQVWEYASAQAEATAEAGLARILGEWPVLGLDSLAAGSRMAVGTTQLDSLTQSFDTVLRLSAGLFLGRVTGERRDAGGMVLARGRLSLLIRMRHPDLPDSAAAMVAGRLVIRDRGHISGSDTVPTGWAPVCGGLPGPGSAGVRLGSGGSVDTTGCTGGCLSGTPGLTFPDSGPPGVTSLHEVGQAALVALADTLVAGAVFGIGPVGGTQCQATGLNWGSPEAPLDPCFGRFPIIAVGASGARLSTGAGQGVLVSQGPLLLEGDFRFYGMIVAPSLVLREQSRVMGQVAVGSGIGDSLVVADDAVLARSRCAADRAARSAGRPFPVETRSWGRWR